MFELHAPSKWCFSALAVGLLAASPAAAERGTADLAALLAEAESSHPALRSASERLSASEQLPSQAEARPDPLATVAYTNDGISDFTLGSSPDATLAFAWIQEVPYPESVSYRETSPVNSLAHLANEDRRPRG